MTQDNAAAASPDLSGLDEIFPTLPFSRREANAGRVRNIINPSDGNGGRHIIGGADGTRVMIADFQFRRNAVGAALGQGYLKFHYKLSGRNVVKFANGPEMPIASGRSAIVYHPGGLAKDDCFAAGAREVSVTIGCRPEVVLDLLGISPDALPKSARRYFDDPDGGLRSDELPLTTAMTEAIHALTRPRFSPWLQKLQAESKILDLMCLSLHELTRHDFGDGKNTLRPRDVDQLHAVKDFLDASIGEDITIKMLCKTFSTNRAKLSAGFRLLFGETIFEYMHRLRMDHAMALITETDVAISEVAETVGYLHQSSFSTAFREYHGLSPLSARHR